MFSTEPVLNYIKLIRNIYWIYHFTNEKDFQTWQQTHNVKKIGKIIRRSHIFVYFAVNTEQYLLFQKSSSLRLRASSSGRTGFSPSCDSLHKRSYSFSISSL